MSIITEGLARFGLSIAIAIIILWMLLLFRAKRNPSKGSLDMLKDRADRGEITQEEYEAARKLQERKD